MDSLIAAAGRALAAGDAIGALGRVALRDDPPALALRGIAMAQLGELSTARDLLRRAIRGFGPREPLSRARCVVAEADVSLALRDLGAAPRALALAASTLDARGDHANAMHARLIAARRLLLLGRLADAARSLHALEVDGASPALRAVAALVGAEIALRSLRTAGASASLARAQHAARQAGIGALVTEVADMQSLLARPAARLVQPGETTMLRLAEVEALFASDTLVVDACRHALRSGETRIALARRPILFALLRDLGSGGPDGVDRNALIAGAFRARHPDDTHRARLRVEIGRLRALVAPLANVVATADGFALRPHGDRDVVVLAPPLDGDQGALLALLADGAAWSTSALALALDSSQRTVQRMLVELESGAQVRSIGRARAQRWLAPPLTNAGELFTTLLLLPAARAGG